MSEQLDRRERDFSKFDSMTTEALQQILRLDAMKPIGEESDTEELLYIMEVLADRRRNDSTYTGKTVQQAFENFQKYYMPDKSNDDAVDAAPAKQNKISVLWLRRIAAVAAALAIVFLTTFTADAFGYDLFGKVAKWSEEFFHFDPNSNSSEATLPDTEDKLEYTSLQEALDINGITLRLAPSYLPNEYLLSKIEVFSSPKEIVFHANYQADGGELIIQIRQLLSSFPIEIEKNDNCVEIFERNGIAYFLFENNNTVQASWVVEEFECFIIGEITIEEMKRIVASI